MNKAGVKRGRNTSWNFTNNNGRYENLEKQLSELMLNNDDGENYSSVNSSSSTNTSPLFKNSFAPLKNSNNRSRTRKISFDPLVRVRNINREGKSERVGRTMNTRTRKVLNKAPNKFPYSKHNSELARFAALLYAESNSVHNAVQKIQANSDLNINDKNMLSNISKENIRKIVRRSKYERCYPKTDYCCSSTHHC
jgi:hypothetical protein